ncbi:hypothetical protein BRARA_E01322 [Brassica rapa]|uniref:DUF4283 domain-containing protein n=1 Tax=Brassica campestris TaxID=3711 RepID=A0A397Z9N5_BRACM|nr:hypothetical protein BRARA_E01322 [Brassica rapa]
MSQGQLVGKGGASKEGEGVRKRLKISVPHFDNSDLIKSYAMTLIGRCMNPVAQKVNSLLVMLPKIWKVEERVTGADLGKGMFQFHFEKEEDIEAVLESQPYHFDYWMISIARWQPRMTRSFPSEIPFWIKVEGLPTEFWSTPALQSIGDAIGETTDVDLDYGKMRVVLDGFKELTLETSVEFKGGEFYDEEEVPVSLKYDKLFGICKLCSSLCHDEDHCPLNPKSVDKKTDSREELANKKEDRARSYKGVVIHGEESQQERGTDQRNYYGKGKGKMHEDQDSKWVRVPERGNKRYSSYHDNNRNDEGNNRHRNTRWEQPRSYVQESREKGHRGTRRERSPPHYAREEPKEEGELQDTGSANKGSQMEGKTSASNNLQIESNGARANLIKLPPKSVEMENGAIAAIVSGTVGAGKGTEPPLGDNGKDMEENEVMDLAENVIPSAGDKGCMGEDEAFENLTDGEMEELNGSQEVVLETVEEESRPTDVEEKELQVGEEEKKKGARKILKHTMAAGASKKKFVQALLSQNKNTQARQGKRQGDGSKLQEDKGSSYPKQTSSKNSTASHG